MSITSSCTNPSWHAIWQNTLKTHGCGRNSLLFGWCVCDILHRKPWQILLGFASYFEWYDFINKYEGKLWQYWEIGKKTCMILSLWLCDDGLSLLDAKKSIGIVLRNLMFCIYTGAALEGLTIKSPHQIWVSLPPYDYGADSIQRCHLSSVRIPNVDIRWAFNVHNLISYFGKPTSFHGIRAMVVWKLYNLCCVK